MSDLYDCGQAGPRRRGLAAAASAVGRGELVVLPTDTVYGIGADAFTAEAVASIFSAKRRGRDMPCPVLVGAWQTLDGLVGAVPEQARLLMEAFWPGGLTIVVRHAPSLSWDLGDARGTVAVRMPLHPVALELLASTGPMAVTSANISGQAPALTAGAAQEQFGTDVSVYLEAGESADQLPSSIVDVTGDAPVLRRAGALSADALREVLPELVEPPAPA